MTRRRAKARGRRTRAAPTSEWIGAKFAAPVHVYDRPDPYRPGIALWIEWPEGFVLGQEVFGQDEADGALARALRSAMAAPAVGEPRQPDAIRVADESAAAEVRAEVGNAIPIAVAPTPEVDQVRDALLEAMADMEGNVEPSYLEDGRIPASTVAALFDAGNKLFALRPWTLSEESPELRMDIPDLDVEGACVVIFGQAGDGRGVLIFPSLDEFDAFLLASEMETYKQGDLGAEALSLTWMSAGEIPPSMRREAMEHGWQVESPGAYPIVMRSGPDGFPQPPTSRDLEIATACAEALAAFVSRHARIFSAVEFGAVSESFVDGEGREVQLTAPYERQVDFGLDDIGVQADDDFSPFANDAPFTPRAKRNETCPCGSGRKYKKCHLPTDEARHSDARRANLLHRMDTELILRMTDFAADEFGEAWQEIRQGLERDPGRTFLETTMAVYSLELNGTTVVDAYLEARSSDCSADERAWLEAQRRAWWSVWEVEAVEPGWSLRMVDLLTGERRTVLDRSASKSLRPRDAILARVVDDDALSLFAAIHPNPLPPLDAAEAVADARRRLRRKRAVPPERLRDGAFAKALVRYWDQALEVLRLKSRLPPDLRNRDGDPLRPTTDRFEVKNGAMAEVARLVAGLDGAVEEDAAEDCREYAMLRSDDDDAAEHERHTVLGWVRLTRTELQIETNSEARADALRRRIETACGNRVRHRERGHASVALPRGAAGSSGSDPAPLSSEDERLAAEVKARHYAEWPDVPLPALGNRTPRACARSAAGRGEVDLLLKQMENMEQRAGYGKPFDFSVLREELGIPG